MCLFKGYLKVPLVKQTTDQLLCSLPLPFFQSSLSLCLNFHSQFVQYQRLSFSHQANMLDPLFIKPWPTHGNGSFGLRLP